MHSNLKDINIYYLSGKYKIKNFNCLLKSLKQKVPIDRNFVLLEVDL